MVVAPFLEPAWFRKLPLGSLAPAMIDTPPSHSSGMRDPEGGPVPSGLTVAAAATGLLAAWVAAGSTGLLSHALRRASVWGLLGVAVVLAWPRGARSGRRGALLVLSLLVAVVMAAPRLPAANVMGVAVVLAALAVVHAGADRRPFALGAPAVAVFALYRLLNTSVPFIWELSDLVGEGIGRAAGALTGESLWVGATFGGVDLLVLATAVYSAWLWAARPPRRRAVSVLVLLLAGHLLYLCLLSLAPLALEHLPPSVDYTKRVWPPKARWSWPTGLRTLIPWNLPMFGALIHAGILLFVLGSPHSVVRRAGVPGPRRRRVLVAAAAALLTVLIPVLTVLSPERATLEGKHLVVYEKGFLNWLKAKHGEYGRWSIGMYGMLRPYVESLGATLQISPDLSQEDLDGADALLLIFPDEPWGPGQLDRIRAYVENGGSLLLMGEHTTVVRRGKAGGSIGDLRPSERFKDSAFNMVLDGTAMRVRFDSATFEVGGWLQSYEALAHPATTGVPDDHNEFGSVIGASVESHWPARPVLVGRWGWNDPGDIARGESMMGNGEYDPGERLGDCVLAVEQRIGKGRIVCFGDTSAMTNGIAPGSYGFTSRLLAYLANVPANPQEPWRGALGLLAGGALAALLLWRRDAVPVAVAAVALAASLAACTHTSYRALTILPDGRDKTPNNVAYIGFGKLEAPAQESWRPDGTAGLLMTLMRQDFLVFDMPDYTWERMRRAAIVVCIAPNEPFSREERDAVRRFVEGGGIFIITVGYDDVGPSRELLNDFGLYVGLDPPGSPDPREPEPLSHFRSAYLQVRDPEGNYRLLVRFNAAWPVGSTEDDAIGMVYTMRQDPNKGAWEQVPVMIRRPVGEGVVLLVGDTGFAMNKNLEHEYGQPFEGLRENAEFWRWLVPMLRGGKRYIPPNIYAELEARRKAAEAEQAAEEEDDDAAPDTLEGD
jgi:hypothetical protein